MSMEPLSLIKSKFSHSDSTSCLFLTGFLPDPESKKTILKGTEEVITNPLFTNEESPANQINALLGCNSTKENR